MSYRENLRKLGADTSGRVMGHYAMYNSGRITASQFASTVASTIAKANGRAVVMADLSLAATLSVEMGIPVTTLGLQLPDGELERLRKAASTLLDLAEDTPDPAARIGRLGRVEPIDAAGKAYSKGTRLSPHVVGYRRGLSGDPCELCQWLHKDGYVYPAEQEMNQHKGCTCTQQPVTRRSN